MGYGSHPVSEPTVEVGGVPTKLRSLGCSLSCSLEGKLSFVWTLLLLLASRLVSWISV